MAVMVSDPQGKQRLIEQANIYFHTNLPGSTPRAETDLGNWLTDPSEWNAKYCSSAAILKQ